MSNTIAPIIEKYLSGITADEFHRYKSWDNCFKAFSTSKQLEIQVLELAFYLESVSVCLSTYFIISENY